MTPTFPNCIQSKKLTAISPDICIVYTDKCQNVNPTTYFKAETFPPFDPASVPIYNSDSQVTSQITAKLGEARNSVAQPGSCPVHPRKQMKAASVNEGWRRGINRPTRQLYSPEKGSGGTVEQSSEDQALVNKQGSLQAASQGKKRLSIISTVSI